MSVGGRGGAGGDSELITTAAATTSIGISVSRSGIRSSLPGEEGGIGKSVDSGGFRRPERTFQFEQNGEKNKKLNKKCKYNENRKQFIININQNKAADEMQ